MFLSRSDGMLQLTGTAEKSGGRSVAESDANDDENGRDRDDKHATEEEPCKAPNSVFTLALSLCDLFTNTTTRIHMCTNT